MTALIVGPFHEHLHVEIETAAQKAGSSCIFVSDIEHARALLQSLEEPPRCVLASVRADLASLADLMRDSVEFYTIPLVGLVPYPSIDMYQLANRQGADDCVPEYDAGGITRRLANLAQGAPPRLPEANGGRAVVAISDDSQRKHVGRRLRSAGFQVEFVSSDPGDSLSETDQELPAILVTSPSLPPEFGQRMRAGASKKEDGSRVPRVNIPISNGDIYSPRDLSELEVSERLMFLVDEATRPVMQDARASRRIQHSAMTTFSTRRSFENTYALTDNISRQGLYVRTLDPPPVGSDVRVNFRDKYGDILQIRGAVAWRFAPSQVGGRTCPGFGMSIAEEACPREDLEKYQSLYKDVLREVEEFEQEVGLAQVGDKNVGDKNAPSGVHRAWADDNTPSEVG